MFHRHRSGCTCILLLALACTLMHPVHAQISGPIEATVGDSQVNMGWGNKPNDPSAMGLIIDTGQDLDPEEYYYYKSWNWTTWWEANAYRYLKPAQWNKQEQDKSEIPEGYQRAESALLKALEDKKQPEVLAECVWALGRMKSTTATVTITKLLKHPDTIVRRNSWLSLGLIEDELAVQTIMAVLDKPNLEPEDAAAWIVAIGLMDKPDPKLLKAMIPIIKQKNVTQAFTYIPALTKCYRNEATFQARMAMWTLRMHQPQGVSEFAQQLMAFTTDPILFDEAIQTIAASPDEQIILKLFNPIYHSRLTDYRKLPRAFGIDGYGAYEIKGFRTSIQEFTPNGLPSLRISAAFAYDNPSILKDSHNGRLIHLVNRQLSRSYAKVQQPLDQGENKAPPIGRPSRLGTYKFDHWRYQHYGGELHGDDIGSALRFGLIPLGNLGDRGLDERENPDQAQLLCDVLLGKYTEPPLAPSRRIGDPITTHIPIPSKFDPSRGFAAIALGLYTRRMPADLSSIRHDKTKDIAKYIERLLTRTAKNNDEPMMLRSACALALGLGGSLSANEQLTDILKTSPPPIVSSYAILALGMLGEQRVPVLVHQAFEKTADQINVEKIRQSSSFIKEDNLKTLSQRVLVQSLGCVGNPQANRMLYPYLTENFYTSRQIIRTLKWSGDTLTAESLIELLENPGKRNSVAIASFSAWSLGELFDPLAYSKAHLRLLKNRNYTMATIEYNTVTKTGSNEVITTEYAKQNHLQQYLQLTNSYLFTEMIQFHKHQISNWRR